MQMTGQYYVVYDSPIGPLYIYEQHNFITHLSFDKKDLAALNKNTALLEKTCAQLDAYFAGSLKEFDLPLNPNGTAFQKAVWHALRNIPYGQTQTYKQIASTVGNDKACRAVGMANNKNPIAVIIPCHRVIGQTGKLVGYAGGLDKKEVLLGIEAGK